MYLENIRVFQGGYFQMVEKVPEAWAPREPSKIKSALQMSF